MYLPERDMLVLLLTKENYQSFFDYLDLAYIKDNYRELSHLYLALKEVHSETDNDVTLPSLQAWFFQKYPDLDKELYLDLFKTLSEAQIDPALGVAMLKQIKARKQALKLSEDAFKFSNGNGAIESVISSYDKLCGEETTKEEFEFVTDDLEDIVMDVFQTSGLRWRLDSLNKSLGSLRKGDFGFLFARPESGKTTFLASEVSFMLEQLPEDAGPIIWFNNEQAGKKVMMRMYQGYFGARNEQLASNARKYREDFRHQTNGKFLLIDDTVVTKHKIERICKQYKPSLIIFDQIDKIYGFAADREDLRLGSIYIWARELAKQYCPAIGICQADGHADGQKWLTMEHVANAKTSKQAEADWILGMGHVFGEGLQYIRYLNISKNKLMGDVDTLPKLRHGKLEVLIEPEIARFKDLIKYE